MAYEPMILATGHTQLVTGAKDVGQLLIHYRDAIRHAVSKTDKGMKAGLDPLMIAAGLKLLAHLADKPYLQESYGQIAYASRAYF